MIMDTALKELKRRVESLGATGNARPGRKHHVAPDPGSAREEAERLVAAALAAVGRFASDTDPHSGHDGPTIATGADECCVCPICRVIAAMRDPDPEFAERLATGAGDLAAGRGQPAARVQRTRRAAPVATPERPAAGAGGRRRPGSRRPGTRRRSRRPGPPPSPRRRHRRPAAPAAAEPAQRPSSTVRRHLARRHPYR